MPRDGAESADSMRPSGPRRHPGRCHVRSEHRSFRYPERSELLVPLVHRRRGAVIGRWAWLLLSTSAVSACHRSSPVLSAANGAASPPACAGEALRRQPGHGPPGRVSGAVDSAATQARVRWAIADLVQSLNSRSAADLSLRYLWIGSSRTRDAFLESVRSSGSTTTLTLDPDDTRWSDAPGKPMQSICLSLAVGSFNAGGLPTSQRVALRALAVDDGRGAWLSQLELRESSP
jgi:hypothetical protein